MPSRLVVSGKAATETTTGLTEGKKCSVCGVMTVPQQVIPTLAHVHTEVVVPGKAATCTESGLTEGKKCSACGIFTIEQATIPVKEHEEKVLAGKSATCTEDGLTEGKKCAVCGKVIKEQAAIPATGHTEVLIDGKAATETTTGLTEGKKCSVCGEITVPQQTIPVLVHVHTEVNIPGKAATCTETGLTNGKKCSACGEITSKQTVIPVMEHSYTGLWMQHDENTHINSCEYGCGTESIVACEYYTIALDPDTYKICPICGVSQNYTLELIVEDILLPEGELPGTFICRFVDFPFGEAMQKYPVMFSLAYEQDGRIALLQDDAVPFELTLPYALKGEFRLFYIAEDEVTHMQNWVEIEFTKNENGITFTAPNTGLFVITLV